MASLLASPVACSPLAPLSVADGSHRRASTSASLSRSDFYSCGSRDLRVSFRPQPSTAVSRVATSTPVCKVKVGDAALPLSLTDQDGKTFTLQKLFSGFSPKNVVLYFYPADETPGCTKQACSFRDAYQDFKRRGAEVIGVSRDSPESHKKFAAKYNLPYTLLSDEGDIARKEWGVPPDLFGVLPGRQTYVIDKKGVVKLIFNNQFQPEKHVEETLAVLGST